MDNALCQEINFNPINGIMEIWIFINVLNLLVKVFVFKG